MEGSSGDEPVRDAHPRRRAGEAGKRATYVTVDELLGEVGPDVFRFFMVQRKAGDISTSTSTWPRTRTGRRTRPTTCNTRRAAMAWAQGAGSRGSRRPAASTRPPWCSPELAPQEIGEFPDVVARAAAREPHHLAYWSARARGLWNPHLRDGVGTGCCRTIPPHERPSGAGARGANRHANALECLGIGAGADVTTDHPMGRRSAQARLAVLLLRLALVRSRASRSACSPAAVGSGLILGDGGRHPEVPWGEQARGSVRGGHPPRRKPPLPTRGYPLRTSAATPPNVSAPPPRAALAPQRRPRRRSRQARASSRCRWAPSPIAAGGAAGGHAAQAGLQVYVSPSAAAGGDRAGGCRSAVQDREGPTRSPPAQDQGEAADLGAHRRRRVSPG
jgi:hypothetical protein